MGKEETRFHQLFEGGDPSPCLSGTAVTQSLLVPVDTGNKQIKTPRHIFTAGLTCHDSYHRPAAQILNQQGKSKSQYIVTALEKRNGSLRFFPLKSGSECSNVPKMSMQNALDTWASRQSLGFYTKGKPPSKEGGGQGVPRRLRRVRVKHFGCLRLQAAAKILYKDKAPSKEGAG